MLLLWLGEPESSRLISGDATSYTLDGLRPGLSYIVRLSAVLDGEETEATTIRGTTGTHDTLYLTFYLCLFQVSFIHYCSLFLDALPPVSGLSVTDSAKNSVLLGWSPVTGATGYILRWTEEEGESFKSSGTDSVWFIKDKKHNYSWIHFLVYCILSLFRHRNSSVWNAARNSHLLPCDRSTTGPPIPFHCATHLPKPGWTWDQRGGTNRLYSFFHTWLLDKLKYFLKIFILFKLGH